MTGVRPGAGAPAGAALPFCPHQTSRGVKVHTASLFAGVQPRP